VHLSASAQQTTRPQRDRRPSTTAPIQGVRGDTILVKQDTLALLDSANNVPKSAIETEILYFAEDSIITDFSENKVYLYKKAWFEYGKMRLDADRIVIDWKNSELYAYGVSDSLGVVSGNPFFKDGNSVYEIRKEMRYNFKTQKAIIKDVVTEQQDGVLRRYYHQKNRRWQRIPGSWLLYDLQTDQAALAHFFLQNQVHFGQAGSYRPL